MASSYTACRDIISAFEEYDSLRGIYLPVLPSTAVLAREQMRGRPDIGIVAGTDSKSTAHTYS
jgi:hypothetical protein